MGSCQRILIVEDNNDIREVLEESLRMEGLAVESSQNGKEALEKLEKTDVPTLVFLDLMMPVMNGWQFLEAFKADKRFAKHRVVTISAVDASKSTEARAAIETDGRIRKPLMLETIWDEVMKHCQHPNKSATA